MKILSKKIVIRNGSLRIVALLCCLIGIFAVWNWQSETHNSIFTVQIQPEFWNKRPSKAEIFEKIIQKRDLSNYNVGKTFSDCNDVEDKEFKQCEKSLDKGRDFIFEHLNHKKRGYIVYKWSGADSGGEIYFFIEPDDYGTWQVIRRREDLYSYSIESLSAISVKRKMKTKDDYKPRAGRFYLSFRDIDRKVVFDL